MRELLLRNAVRNIRRNPLRSGLSMLIVAMMVMFFVSLQTIMGLFTHEFAGALTRYDLVIQSKFANSPLTSKVGADLYDALKKDRRFDAVDAARIERISINRRQLWCVGISNYTSFASRFGVLVVKGRLYGKTGHEMIAGNRALHILRRSLGDTTKLNANVPYTITGVFRSMFSLLNSAVVMNLRAIEGVGGASRNVNILFLSAATGEDLEALVSSIESAHPALKVLKTEQIGQSMTALRDIERITTILSWLIFISAAVAILNTLLITTLQRTREIGILAAIGWKRRNIVALFWVESLLLCGAAAALGLLLARPLLYVIRTYTSLGIYVPDAISLTLMGAVAVLAVVVSAVGVLAPSIYVMRMSISKALRHE